MQGGGQYAEGLRTSFSIDGLAPLQDTCLGAAGLLLEACQRAVCQKGVHLYGGSCKLLCSWNVSSSRSCAQKQPRPSCRALQGAS